MNPVKSLHTIVLCLVIVTPMLSRGQRAVQVSYSIDKKGAYVFSATNKAFCPYVINLKFTNLANGRSDHSLPFTGELKPGANTLFRISKIDPSQDLVYQYTFSVRKGCLYTTPQIDWGYILPVAIGKETQAYVTETNTDAGRAVYAIRLRMKPGDTIFASRKGIVTAIDVGSSQNDAGLESTAGWNAIEIFQPDSSFAEYGVIKKDGALVKPGQTVEAGTPIGLVGGDAYGRGSEARLSIFYYQNETLKYIPLQLWTKENSKTVLRHGAIYTSVPAPAPPAPPAKPKPGLKKKPHA